MNRLPRKKRAQLLNALCEGMSLRATARVGGVAYNTVLTKLQVEAGRASYAFHDANVRNLSSSQVECDELWAFCHTRRRQDNEPLPEEYGDVYTWIALDPITKLVICWWCGNRTTEDAVEFMGDLKGRLQNEAVLISTDALSSYASGVETVFGGGGAVHNISKIDTTHIERANLTLRMGNRRFTRKTNAHSKKLLNHDLSLALFFTFYNYCRTHMSLGALTTPAMAAGLATFPMTLGELADLTDQVD